MMRWNICYIYIYICRTHFSLSIRTSSFKSFLREVFLAYASKTLVYMHIMLWNVVFLLCRKSTSYIHNDRPLLLPSTQRFHFSCHFFVGSHKIKISSFMVLFEEYKHYFFTAILIVLWRQAGCVVKRVIV